MRSSKGLKAPSGLVRLRSSVSHLTPPKGPGSHDEDTVCSLLFAKAEAEPVDGPAKKLRNVDRKHGKGYKSNC